MLTEVQYAYLAGIIDGEGHVSVARQIRSDRTRLRDYGYRATVNVTQRNPLLLETIRDWIGKENASICKTGKDNAYWNLRFKAPWMREHLPRIADYLILKRKHLEVILWFLSHQHKWVGRHGAGAEVWAERDEMFAKIRALNAR